MSRRNGLIRILQALVLVAVAVSFAHADQNFVHFKKKAAAAAASYIFTETFEGTNDCGGTRGNYCDVTWTNTFTAWEPHYSTAPAPLEGSYSANRPTGTEIQRDFTAQDEVYWSAMINPASSADYQNLVALKDSGNNVLCNIEVAGSGLHINVTNTGGTARESGNILSNGTTIYLKLRAKKGTGADAECQAYWSSDGSSWTAGTLSNNGTWTAQISRVHHLQSASMSFVIDDIRVDESDINY